MSPNFGSDGTEPTREQEAVHQEPHADRHRMPMSIPGSQEEAAEEVDAVSVEGRPADARSGPKFLWIEIALVGVIVVAGAVAVGVWIGAFAAIAAVFLGLLALLANPSVSAAMMRTKDRDEAAKHAREHGDRVVR
jgi:hypothetical protein